MSRQLVCKYQANSSTIFCLVLALVSWNYYSGVQDLTSKHLSLSVNLSGFTEKEEVEIPVLCHLVTGEFSLRWQDLIFHLDTLFSCVKMIVQPGRYVGLSDIALQSTSSNCLVLILHRQLGNLLLWSQLYEGKGLFDKEIALYNTIRKLRYIIQFLKYGSSC